MAYAPNKWGPASTTLDYIFYMAGLSPSDPLISLLEHTLTSPSQELSDPVTVPEERLVNGRRTVFQRTVRPAQQTALTYTLQFPSSLWTPALDRARRLGGCSTDFFALRTCLPDEFEHAYIYPDAIMDPPAEVGDFITLEDGTPVQEQTTLRVRERLILWGLRARRMTTATDPLYAVAFNNPDCPGCEEDLYTDFFAGGGDGTAAAYGFSSNDRFGTLDEATTGIPAGSIITSQYTAGDIVLVGFADEATPAGGTGALTGGTALSSDGGSTFTLDTNLTTPIFGVGYAFGQYVAVGGTGSGAPTFYVSDNGIQWTAVTSSALAGTDALLDIAVDPFTGDAYAVGEGGLLLKASFSGGGVVINDISANLPGTPGVLHTVAVLGEDRIVVGGAAAYAAESLDGGATFSSLAVPGAGIIGAMAGDKYRLIVGIGNKLWERSILTKNAFRQIEISDGVVISGNYTAIAMPGETGYARNNYFVLGTDVGEVVMLVPAYPNA